MNPFYHGNPVIPRHFLGRKKELRRICQRIHSSQSSAIVGEPRTGKTSLLLYLASTENQTQLLTDEASQYRYFSYLDVLAFTEQTDQTQFWVSAFAPIFSAGTQANLDIKSLNLYSNCLKNGFSNHSLTILFDQLAVQSYHLVLLVDEFDVLLNLPKLCQSEFLGSLRSLASIWPALTLVIASRQSISNLNNLTQQLNNTGSPYFNIFEEYALPPFSEQDVELLLNRANGRFTPRDMSFIAHTAGNHPYLLQAIAAELWAIYEDGEELNPDDRRHLAGQALYDVVARTLGNTWVKWTPQIRMAITVVALGHTPHLLEKRFFNSKKLLRDLRDFGSEIRYLEKQGYIKKSVIQSGEDSWRISPAAFHWWVVDELIRTVRSDRDFAEWVRAQEWEGLLTTEEKQYLIRAGKYLADLLKGGVSELIKAIAGD